jgi:hypothetical protein
MRGSVLSGGSLHKIEQKLERAVLVHSSRLLD